MIESEPAEKRRMNMRKWYEMEACNQGPIIGGQVYLVRNIMGYPFEAKMNEEEQKALMAAVCYAVRQSGSSEEVCVY